MKGARIPVLPLFLTIALVSCEGPRARSDAPPALGEPGPKWADRGPGMSSDEWANLPKLEYTPPDAEGDLEVSDQLLVTGLSRYAETYGLAFTLVSPEMALPRRVRHTATRLDDGRILVAGGYHVTGSLPTGGVGERRTLTAQIYDPSTKQWSPTLHMQAARAEHTATLLNDGRVLIAGGIDPTTPGDGSGDPDPRQAEIFDPATNSFSSIQALMIAPRQAHAATLLPNGRVLLSGGFERTDAILGRDPLTGRSLRAPVTVILNSMEVFDPASGTFLPVANMLAARSYHTATLTCNNAVLLIGGVNSRSDGLVLVEEWDEEQLEPGRTWTTVRIYTLTTGRSGHTATLTTSPDLGSEGAAVLVAGGYDESFVPISTAEIVREGMVGPTQSIPMREPRANHAAVRLSPGRVLLVGGETGDASGTSVTRSAERYAHVGGTFSDAGDMATPRVALTATAFDPAASEVCF